MNSNSNGDSHVADPVDIVHHEMDSVVCTHYVYTTVWSPVIEQLILEKEPAGQCASAVQHLLLQGVGGM